ncbi:YwbE family protein [Clostridium beijerinckii]|nr:YwbE family protein [Clostridium beijerinckii]
MFILLCTNNHIFPNTHHQRTGKLTEGIVKRILTNSQNHHRGIKVMLEDNVVGRVQQIK